MNSPSIVYRPIGIVRSEHHIAEKTPIQSAYAEECLGQAEIFPAFSAGLADLDGFSHVYLIYHFHQAGPASLLVKPFLQDEVRGIFATRSPRRPNPIGLSIVELLGRNENVLQLRGLDILDGTPLLDIKPYTSRFDRFDTKKNGWQDEVDESTAHIKGRRLYRSDRS